MVQAPSRALDGVLPSPLSERKVTFFVPKFHLLAHVDKCQMSLPFNFIPSVGRTDGEAPERGWANINTVASNMKEMWPGARRGKDGFPSVSLLPGQNSLGKLKVAISMRTELKSALEDN